jgi:raffinose/stachyose/melibiose transport system substrate-binding protein
MVSIVAVSALLLAACGGGSDAGGSSQGADKFSVLLTNENSSPPVFDALKANECKDANAALPYELSQTPSADMQSKVQLLAGQGALPVLYPPSQSLVLPGGDLEKTGVVLNLEKTLNDLGVGDQVTPIAKSVVHQLYQDTFPTLPMQFNIEGIFYNKKIFADNGIEVPTTLDALIAAAQKLKAAGVTPFVASGKTGWTISRWVGALIYSMIGPDALQKVADGKAKLTDPEYVAAAQKLQDMGPLFIGGITNLDYDTMNAQMLTGKAAMMYMGTWFLAQVNDPSMNKVGDDIGFMAFPGIDGFPANVGSPNVINAKLYNDKVGAWLKCIAKGVGYESLKNGGTFSGFKVNGTVDDLPALTQDVQNKIDSATKSVLWFEALMPQKATQDSSANAAPLLTGAMSAKDFMALLQSDLDSKQ